MRQAWPGALDKVRSPEELRSVVDRAARSLIGGRTGAIDELFAEMDSPPPTLVWSPDEQLRHTPVLEFLNRYWHQRREGDRPPSSRVIDPLDLVPALGFVMLLEPVDAGYDFRYRVYGTTIAEYSQAEMTGRLVGDIPAPLVATYFQVTYRAVHLSGRPLFAHHRSRHDMRVSQWDRIILPFVDASGSVDRLLVGNVPRLRGRPVA